jgi:hypothetical protein
MYVSATKAQVEDIIAVVSVQNAFYSSVLSNVTMIALGTSNGYVSIAVSGIYSETDFLSAVNNAKKVSAIVL